MASYLFFQLLLHKTGAVIFDATTEKKEKLFLERVKRFHTHSSLKASTLNLIFHIKPVEVTTVVALIQGI